MNVLEIIVCPECKGYGKKDKSELEDYHRNEYRHWDEACKNCNGLGRIKKITTIKHKILTKKDLTLVS